MTAGPTLARAARGDTPTEVAQAAPRGAIPDAELVERARGGDRWAEEALFRRYIGPITRLSTRLIGCVHDADDVVQETFAEALRDLASLREPAAFRSWLFRIAVNRAKKAYRKRKVLRILGLDRGDDATLDRLAADGVSAEQRAELARIDEALRSVGVHERTAWLLHYAEGETLEAIAQMCGYSLATAKRRIQAAQAALDAHVEERSLRRHLAHRDQRRPA